MMQQLGAGQGMFPMLQPNMWNMPMSQWPQFSAASRFLKLGSIQ
jgi:hypothetical protein